MILQVRTDRLKLKTGIIKMKKEKMRSEVEEKFERMKVKKEITMKMEIIATSR